MTEMTLRTKPCGRCVANSTTETKHTSSNGQRLRPTPPPQKFGANVVSFSNSTISSTITTFTIALHGMFAFHFLFSIRYTRHPIKQQNNEKSHSKLFDSDTWERPMMFIWSPLILLLFCLIASTADLFFVPILSSLSAVLKLSPSVSGATLIALANGAPDFFCSIAGMSGVQQTDTIIGGFIGGTALIALCILGVVVIVAPYQSKRRLFLRDSLCLLATLVLFGGAIHCDTIHVAVGWAMFSIYGLYVLLVIFSKRIAKALPQTVRSLMSKTNLFDAKFRRRSLVLKTVKEGVPSESMLEMQSTKRDTQVVRELDLTSDEEDIDVADADAENPDTDGTDQNQHTGTLEVTATAKNGEDVAVDDFEEQAPSTTFLLRAAWTRVAGYFGFITEWSEQSYLGKAIVVIEAPFTLLRILTIPMLPEEPQHYHRALVVAALVASPIWVIWSFAKSFLVPIAVLKHVPVYVASLAIGFLSHFLLLPRDAAPQNRKVRGLLLSVSMACCASWIMLFANELLALLALVAGILGMSDEAAGYTVLAAGNSVPDLMVNVSAAKSGDVQAALTACFAGAIFNILCSFGAAIAVSGIDGMTVNGGFKYSFTFCFVLVGVLCVVIKTAASKYYLGKSTGIAAVCWYALFLFFAVWSGFQSLKPPGFILGK